MHEKQTHDKLIKTKIIKAGFSEWDIPFTISVRHQGKVSVLPNMLGVLDN